MRVEILAAAGLIASTVFGVRVLDHATDERSPAASDTLIEPASSEPYEMAMAAGTDAKNSLRGREVRITAAHDHQFYVTAGVNQHAAQFLIDTGASYVALRESDARAAGVYTSWADYTVPIRTANGESKAALVTIKEIEIDGLRVRDVKAFVLPDEQLGVNLLGMSFLSRLESVVARGGVLVLTG